MRPGKEKGKGKKRRKRRDKVKPEIVKERGFKTLRLEREEIVEIDYRPSKAKRTYRLVILRKTILVEKGQKRLLPQTRYHFYVTNIPAAQLACQNNLVILEYDHSHTVGLALVAAPVQNHNYGTEGASRRVGGNA